METNNIFAVNITSLSLIFNQKYKSSSINKKEGTINIVEIKATI